MCRPWSIIDDQESSNSLVDMLLQSNQISHQNVQFRETKLTTSPPFQASCRSHIIFEPGKPVPSSSPVKISTVQSAPVLIPTPEINDAKFASFDLIQISGKNFEKDQKVLLNGFDFPFAEIQNEEQVKIDVSQDSANVFSIQIEGKYGKSNQVQIIRPTTTTTTSTTTTTTIITTTTTTKATTSTRILRKALVRPQLRAVSQVSFKTVLSILTSTLAGGIA